MSEDDSDDPRAEERVGTVLAGKWTLERLLGLGGMGAVYAARHRNGARAAIKLLHPELARNTEVRERFRRESYAANRVGHRSTVRVLDDDVISDGPDEGAAYLVMELLEGESLEDRAIRGRLDEREVLEVLDTVLDVLEVAHDKGVVHRDLKPENLFLAKDSDTGVIRLKVLDFGLARLAEAARVTGHGLALGTPAFMSPEQAAGLPDIDGRADLFALGATAFFLLTGKNVHEAETVLQQIIKMAKDQAPALKSVAPEASEDVAAIIDRALQVDRDARYVDAGSMHADVRAALERRAAIGAQRTLITAAPSIPPEGRGTNPPPSGVEGRDLRAEPSGRPESAGRRFPLAAFLLLGLVGLAWLLWPQMKARIERAREVEEEPAVDAAAPLPTSDAGELPSSVTEELDADLARDGEADDASVLELDVDDGGSLDGGDEEEDDEEEEDDDAGPHAEGGAPILVVPHPTVRPAVKHPTSKPGTKKKKKRKSRRTR